MKTYKTWEVIKAITEKPELKFRNLRMNGIIGLNCGDLVWLKSSSGDLKDFTMHHNPESAISSLAGGFCIGNMLDDWKLVQQPVPFMEVAEAFDKGKTISCECGDRKSVYVPCNSSKNGSNYFTDTEMWKITTKEILQGKWYIED